MTLLVAKQDFSTNKETDEVADYSDMIRQLNKPVHNVLVTRHYLMQEYFL